MKKQILLVFCLCFTVMVQATISKTVNVTAGGLSKTLTTKEKNSITDLKVTGTIDARDFLTMYNMPVLAIVDLSETNINAYNGMGGNNRGSSATYDDNTVPSCCFYDPMSFAGKPSLTSIILPSSVNSIGTFAFSACPNLTGTLTIPVSVTSIGIGAFKDCSELTTLNFNATNCTDMGDSYPVFAGCSSLNTINIGSDVVFLPVNAFKDCTSLSTINYNATNCPNMNAVLSECKVLRTLNIGNNVKTIPVCAFANCHALTGVLSIPSSVTSIGFGAFANCSHFTGTLSIPSSITTIKKQTFLGCSGFTSITIPSSVTAIGEDAFANCSGFTGTLTIPSSVSTIEKQSFYGCSSLSSIIISSLVTSIGGGAFANCSGLTSIYLYSTTPVDLSSTNEVFEGIDTSTCILHVPANSVKSYKAANQWSAFTNIVGM